MKRAPNKHAHKLRLGALVVFGAVAALVLRWKLHGHLTPQTVAAYLVSIQHEPWSLPVFFAAYFVLCTLFVPTVVFHVASGVAWGFVGGLVINVIASNAVANLQFWIAQRLGRDRVHAWLSAHGHHAWEVAAEENGFRAVFVIRFLPIPTMVVSMGAAVSGIRWRDFAIATVLGTFPVTALYTYFAAALVEGDPAAQRRVMVKTVATGAILTLLALTPKALKWLRARRAARV